MTRQTEISGKCAKFGRAFDPALNVNPFDGVAFFNIINILEKVQVQVKAIGSFHRVGQLLPLSATLTCLSLKAIAWERKYYSHIVTLRLISCANNDLQHLECHFPFKKQNGFNNQADSKVNHIPTLDYYTLLFICIQLCRQVHCFAHLLLCYVKPYHLLGSN